MSTVVGAQKTCNGEIPLEVLIFIPCLKTRYPKGRDDLFPKENNNWHDAGRANDVHEPSVGQDF